MKRQNFTVLQDMEIYSFFDCFLQNVFQFLITFAFSNSGYIVQGNDD